MTRWSYIWRFKGNEMEDYEDFEGPEDEYDFGDWLRDICHVDYEYEDDPTSLYEHGGMYYTLDEYGNRTGESYEITEIRDWR